MAPQISSSLSRAHYSVVRTFKKINHYDDKEFYEILNTCRYTKLINFDCSMKYLIDIQN